MRRRYQDFVWLHTTLSLEYPACIVPPLPEKHRLGNIIASFNLGLALISLFSEYIKGDRFSTEFIQRRQLRQVVASRRETTLFLHFSIACNGFWTEYQDIPYCKSHNAPVSFWNQLILYVFSTQLCL